MVLTDERSVVEEVRTVFGKLDEMKASLARMNTELAERTDYESESYAELIDRISNLSDLVQMEESENGEAELEKTLLGLGFVRSDFDRNTSEFSGGWRMRIELAKMLLQNPDVLLLDEPTSNLDPRNQYEMMKLVRTVADEKNITVLVVIHDLSLALRFCDRFLLMKDGSVYASGDSSVLTDGNIYPVYGMHAYIETVHGVPVVVMLEDGDVD